MGMACSTHGEKRNAYRIFVEKLEEKRQLGRPKLKWEVRTKVDLKETGRGWTRFMWFRIGTSGGLF
jgi:hypothetical protein